MVGSTYALANSSASEVTEGTGDCAAHHSLPPPPPPTRYGRATRRSPWRLKPLQSITDGEGGSGGSVHGEASAIELTSISPKNSLQHNDGQLSETRSAEAGKEHDEQNENDHRLPRHLVLFDLISIGVGGTIGSGIFVLCGLIASEYAGPATCISWAIAGCAAFLSGFCYAELSGRIPSAGSSYAYAFCSMGELFAFVTAACLTLEFLVSGAAVARSWGDKVVEWLKVEWSAGDWVETYLAPGFGINPPAAVVSMGATALVFCGVQESKRVTDIFTWTKVALVVFMAVGGLILLKPTNLQPFVPPEFGASGVIRGATTSFFGYLGFDGICAVAGEAKNPQMNLPRSIMITLVIVTVLYFTAAVALTGMQKYTDISPESGFPEAFEAAGVHWAAQLSAAGEVVTLPVVVLISVTLQPRLQYALAMDGLLPPMFCEVDQNGNLRKGTIVAGSLMTLIATFVPFEYLDDFVSAGILVAFMVTNSSLVVMRIDSPENHPFMLEKLLLTFNVLSLVSCLVVVHGTGTLAGKVVAAFSFVLTLLIFSLMSIYCPHAKVFGGSRAIGAVWDKNAAYFRTPNSLVPLIPCLGTIFNCFLISQLEFWGIILLLLYFGLVIAYYFCCGGKNSTERKGGAYDEVGRNDTLNDAAELRRKSTEDGNHDNCTESLSLPDIT